MVGDVTFHRKEHNQLFDYLSPTTNSRLKIYMQVALHLLITLYLIIYMCIHKCIQKISEKEAMISKKT